MKNDKKNLVAGIVLIALVTMYYVILFLVGKVSLTAVTKIYGKVTDKIYDRKKEE